MHTSADIARAEATFTLAMQIVNKGAEAAREYALTRLAAYEDLNGRDHKAINSEAKRVRWIGIIASNAERCAQKIKSDGRAYYSDQDGLIICTLSADASAGAVGYKRAC
ncbi:hypothetical protein QOZ96_003312 [Brevundimonas nasdae]|uniref:Uncharacterized protein n=1 Tax=Brevundimonas nasdae TaxID=172043 RepID=A0ABX8TMF0_9CAUL|nr:hypothetical protein [Brevundimonas nasdae]MBK6026938.1 hypothetical protein [Brevundimonas nasdae]MDQ0453342.1 hypothetical protein [Brevundimonas nasdae]QYC12416.1 hypothetical protein KWG56_18405 [Brevundimonas nasdae]